LIAAGSDTGALRRHDRGVLCPVCGGHRGLPQHRAVRCAGFTLDAVAYCTRAERAGFLPIDITLSPPAYKHRLFGACGCGQQHGWGAVSDVRIVAPRRRPSVPIDERHEIYGYSLDCLTLRDQALDDLTRRGLSAEAAVAAGYRSIPRKGTELAAFLKKLKRSFGEARLRACPGFTDKNSRLTFWSAIAARDGYVIPYLDEDQRTTGLQVKVLGGRYLTARGTHLADVYHLAGDVRRGCDLILTEGANKANVSNHLAGIPVFAVAGQALMPEHIDAIMKLEPGRVIVALDQEENTNTDRARERWLKTLYDAGLPVYRAVWEGSDVGGSKGIDDLVAAGGRPRMRRAVVTPAEISTRRIPREVPVAGDIERGSDLAMARILTSDAIEDFIGDTQTNAGKALLVRTPPGAGKTRATAAALKAHGVHGRVAVGTTRLARELSDEFGYPLVDGRGPKNCERFDVVEALAAHGHDIEELACGTKTKPRCPVRATCVYYRQFEQIGTCVAGAEQLFNPKFLRSAGVVVVDDADLVRSLIDRTYLTPDTLARCHALLERRRRRTARAVVEIVQHALVDAPTRRLFGAAVWDHFARTARRHGVDFAELVKQLPTEPTIPPPEPGADGVLTVQQVKDAPPASVLPLLRALREELTSFLTGEDFNSGIRLDAAGVEISSLRAPAMDRWGSPILAEKPLLVLEATPAPSLVDHLTRLHDRLPDVQGTVTLPANATVVQYAGASNGYTILRDEKRLKSVLAEVAAERQFSPKSATAEAAVCFLANRTAVLDLGFATEQVLTFGSARGSNVLASVERLHVIGRPMPPADDLAYLAQVLHRDGAPVSSQLRLVARGFGGQPYEVDVVDFEDARVSELLKATRDDEIVQVIHRARLLTIESQGQMFEQRRKHVRLVLHTGHPVPGLRVDELRLTSDRADLNTERSQDAERRIIEAAARLEERGEPLSVNAIAKEAAAHKQTVAKVLGTSVHTLRDLSKKGMNPVPQTSDGSVSSPASEPAANDQPTCLGGCEKSMPSEGRNCSDCATNAVVDWKRRQRGVRSGDMDRHHHRMASVRLRT